MVDVKVILLIENDKMNEYLCPHIELETPRVYVCMYTMVMAASTRRWTLTSPKFYEAFVPRSHSEKFLGEPILVNVKVTLLVEDDKMGEHLHPHIELETLRVYTSMYTMVMDT